MSYDSVRGARGQVKMQRKSTDAKREGDMNPPQGEWEACTPDGTWCQGSCCLGVVAAALWTDGNFATKEIPWRDTSFEERDSLRWAA